MDNWTFTVELMKASASIITELAWQAVVFGIVYLYRTGKIRAKYGKWEVWLGKAEKTAEALQEPPANAIAPSTPEEEQRFSELVKEAPREVILAKRTKLEEAIVSYAEAKELVVPGPRRNIANLIRLLRKRGFIDKTVSTLLDDLRSIGNSVALDVSEPTENEAVRYGELADDVIEQLNFLTSEVQEQLEKANSLAG